MSRQLRVGYSFWGILEKPEKSSSVATTGFVGVGERYLVVEELQKRGHQVYSMQKRREAEPFPGVIYEDKEFPELDVLFVEWRWQQSSTIGVDGRIPEPDWDRQVELLDTYIARGTPVVVHDADLKLTVEDEQRWPDIIISEPSLGVPDLNRKKLRKSRIQIYWAFDYKQITTSTKEHAYEYVYAGNNYERPKQFLKYIGQPSHDLRRIGVQTSVYGNWLESAIGRDDPKELIQRFPAVSFGGRKNYHACMQVLSDSLCSIAISKFDYYEHGLVALRTYEGICANTPMLIPQEHLYLQRMSLNGVLGVSSSEDVVQKVKWLASLPKRSRNELVIEQKLALKSIDDFSPEKKIDVILSCIR